jgi:ribosome maturation factor RimP
MPSGQAGPSPDASRHELRSLLAPVVATAGYDLEDVTVRAVGRRSLIRVTVDADRGVDLDGAAQVSRAISDTLDSAAPGGAEFAGPYVLEVTSPGVDRPLSEPRHWRRAIGRLVSVQVADRPLTGRIVGTDDDGVSLDVEGAERRHVPWHELGRGKVRVEFNRRSDGAAQDGKG